MNFDFEYGGLMVIASVEELNDPYGTGDSPTQYEVEIIEMYDEGGVPIYENNIPDALHEQIIDEAISIYKD